MKRLVLVVKPFRLDAVLEALLAGKAQDIAFQEVRGYGRQKGHLELYRGSEYAITFLPKIRVECRVPDSALDETLGAVRDAARTGRIGDGKVFIFDEVALPTIGGAARDAP